MSSKAKTQSKAAGRGAANGRAQSSAVKKHKYRSIKKVHREKIVKDRRLQAEGERYQHDVEIEMLEALNEADRESSEPDEEIIEAREKEIEQRSKRIDEIDRQISIFNNKLLDISEEKDEDDEKEEDSDG